MALLKKLWQRLTGHQGLIPTLAVVAEPHLVHGYKGDCPYPMGRAVVLVGPHLLQNTLTGRQAVHGDSTAGADQMPGFPWGVEGCQK